ncbi:ATP-grasp fold amidoligase family protein [Acinetobacter thermotolerans]|uniref:ATP-grasp fold amidoligase family protein n=1 Tax=Acinetobacter thermotolerans TaxID=3151487 RepID=UPI00325B808B
MSTTPPKFSFRNKVREAIYIRRTNIKNGFNDKIYSLDKKSVAYPFVEKFGVSYPKVYFKNTKLSLIDFSEIKGSFVLKPEQAHSSLGVFLCHYDDKLKKYRDLFTNEIRELNDIKKMAADIMVEKKIHDQWLVEELVYPDDGQLYALDDWKFYCFYGEVGLILQKRKSLDGNVTYKLYDKDFVQVKNTGKYLGKIDDLLPLPKFQNEMIDIAQTLSGKIPLPFMRVDLFSSSRGVVFGEFTPFPGGFSMFWNTWNEKLGKMWVEAEARLDRDIKLGHFYNLYSQI